MKKDYPTVGTNKSKLLRCFFFRYLSVWKNTKTNSIPSRTTIDRTGQCERPTSTKWKKATLRRKEKFETTMKII